MRREASVARIPAPQINFAAKSDIVREGGESNI
jgi:hypothetical protein